MRLMGGVLDEFHNTNRAWNRTKIIELVRGVRRFLVDGEVVEEDVDSWYSLRAAAYDRGRPEAVLDTIQLESLLDRIDDQRVKAAIILCLNGFHDVDIGMLLSSRRNSVPGRKLVERGIREMSDMAKDGL